MATSTERWGQEHSVAPPVGTEVLNLWVAAPSGSRPLQGRFKMCGEKKIDMHADVPCLFHLIMHTFGNRKLDTVLININTVSNSLHQ